MSHLNKVHSIGQVPFSWENSPGISKVTQKESPRPVGQETHKLPPPPCPSDSPKVVGIDLQIPLPPCMFQPPLRSSSKKGIKREDPFLAAYMECTKSVGHGKLDKNKHKGGAGRRLVWSLFEFSCKRSSGVKEDSLVRLTQDLPLDPSEDLWRWKRGMHKDIWGKGCMNKNFLSL